MSGKNNNSQQIQLQQEQLVEQRRLNDRQVQFIDAQVAALKKTQVAEYKPMSPPPTPGTAGSDFAAYQQTVEEARRYGYKNTVRGGVRTGLGGRQAA